MSQSSPASCEAVPSRERVLGAVKRIVAEFSNTKPDEIQESHLLFEDLGWDSLDLVECTMEIEEEFDISVPDDRTERIKTVGDIVDGVLAILTPSRAGE